MEGGQPIRLVALGYQGFGNLGDEAILTGIERLLAGTPVTVSAVITGPRPDSVPAYPIATRILSPRLLPTPRSLRALQRADGLLLAGGGLIHDHWASVLPRYLTWILAARLLGRPVGWLGVGVGPLRRRPWRWMARAAARLSRVVVVRDARSAALLEGAGRPFVAPDMAFFNRPASDPRDRTGAVGIIVRDPGPGGAAWRPRLVQALASCSTDLASDGHPSVLLTMAGEVDSVMVGEIQAEVARHGSPPPEHEALEPSPDRAIARLAELHGVISVRLHGFILGLLAGTPSAAIAYDDKVMAVAAELGLEGSVVRRAEVTGQRLMAALQLASDEPVHSAALARVEQLRSRAAEIADRFVTAFRDGTPDHG